MNTQQKLIEKLRTFDLVQLGYPYPDHGEMVERDEGKGEWIKKSEISALESELKEAAIDEQIILGEMDKIPDNVLTQIRFNKSDKGRMSAEEWMKENYFDEEDGTWMKYDDYEIMEEYAGYHNQFPQVENKPTDLDIENAAHDYVDYDEEKDTLLTRYLSREQYAIEAYQQGAKDVRDSNIYISKV